MDTVDFNMSYGTKTYKGDSCYDGIELEQKGSATLHFWGWTDAEDDEEAQPLFPRSALKDIDYTLIV